MQVSGLTRDFVAMSPEPTARLWRIRANDFLHRVTDAGLRLSASITVNKSTVLAAADELWAATRDARAWVMANPCPDPKLSDQVAEFLSDCAEVALSAQRAATHPLAETEQVMGHIGGLLALIDLHARRLGYW